MTQNQYRILFEKHENKKKYVNQTAVSIFRIEYEIGKLGNSSVYIPMTDDDKYHMMAEEDLGKVLLSRGYTPSRPIINIDVEYGWTKTD